MPSRARSLMMCSAVAAAAASIAQAQCTAAWQSDFASGGVGSNGNVRCLTALANGDFLIGGNYTTLNSVAVPNKIALFSPATQTVTPLGTTGTNGSIVWACAVLPDGDVVAGGNFTSIGGVATRQLARYDFGTQAWSTMNYGTNGGQVNSILVLPSGNELIIGGNFFRVANMLVEHCARLNLVTGVWSTMGSNMSSTGDLVNVVAQAPDGTVILGGTFLSGGGSSVAALRIARYNPATGVWSRLGSGVNNAVEGVVVLPNGDVIAAGSFTMAGSVPVARIARYNPASDAWSALGAGIPGGFDYVDGLALRPDGTVLVGGTFQSAGGVGANRVALYSPSTNTWSALGAGLNNSVLCVAALPNGDAVVGGFFSTAGGISSNAVARYSFGGAGPSIAVQPQDTAACDSGSAAFSAAATGNGPFTYQWFHGVTPINPVVNPSAATATLSLTGVSVADAGAYHAAISNSCGSSTTSNAVLTVNSADFNGDGDIGTDQDIEAFFRCLAGNCCALCGVADFNADGDIGTDQDIEAFFRVLAGSEC